MDSSITSFNIDPEVPAEEEVKQTSIDELVHQIKKTAERNIGFLLRQLAENEKRRERRLSTFPLTRGVVRVRKRPLKHPERNSDRQPTG